MNYLGEMCCLGPPTIIHLWWPPSLWEQHTFVFHRNRFNGFCSSLNRNAVAKCEIFIITISCLFHFTQNQWFFSGTKCFYLMLLIQIFTNCFRWNALKLWDSFPKTKSYKRRTVRDCSLQESKVKSFWVNEKKNNF